jgi:hypothetical protein
MRYSPNEVDDSHPGNPLRIPDPRLETLGKLLLLWWRVQLPVRHTKGFICVVPGSDLHMREGRNIGRDSGPDDDMRRDLGLKR